MATPQAYTLALEHRGLEVLTLEDRVRDLADERDAYRVLLQQTLDIAHDLQHQVRRQQRRIADLSLELRRMVRDDEAA